MTAACKQTEKPLASIIMPAYNVELYIRETLESLLCQTEDSIEVLVVDDGSTDDTYSIVNEYALKDKRVKLLHVENGGPSRARNLAIEIAKGKYYLFVDADDLVAPDYVETLISLIIDNNCQCSACGISAFRKRESADQGHCDAIIYSDDRVKYLALDRPRGFLCNKGFLASLIVEKNLRLREDVHQSEDMLFLLEYFSYCNRVAYVEEAKYYYRQRRGSLTNSLKNDKWFDVLTVFEAYKDSFDDNPDARNAVRKSFLPVAYEGQYRYRIVSGSDSGQKARLDAMLAYCEPVIPFLPWSNRAKLLILRYCMGLVLRKRLGGGF